ncbi:MAG: nitrogenase molybdenum-iron protein subunit alpha [Dolichospermum sp. DEX189]|uniref:Nitrogenase molybdenum-iron protein subunit alpha n=1 Tax=Aphanizomenon flos-aquae FACHB-1040 TaxID=2692887 RepID=A0ABR8BYL3_APHFL|nr:nitrogenase molybdenum-iron protein subunit alpha [Aphanizomenon flos-aquae FACHB-1040]MBO1069041.1 nitrogenase molybdenum-iron protein subunit alpha [Dolichospermum sp. DEX189]
MQQPLNHQNKYSGPYHGYDGFAIFARDMDLALNSPTWGLIGAPWNKKAQAKAKAKASV